MRIISGKYRHRLINYPEDNPNIRPTKDRIREAIFSAIGDISNKTILDLYAGSGSMGLEALSRYADFCYFVDHNILSIDVIKQNVNDLKITNASILYKEDIKAIEELSLLNKKIDIVFIDPPYAFEKYNEIVELLLDKVLNEGAIIVIESRKDLDYSKYSFKKIKKYSYGDITVDICWR